MRLHFLAAILALLPVPALADVTARYSAGKDVLLVEVDDGGNSRIGIEGKFSIIHRDGVDYVVRTTPAGEVKVTELAEALSFFSDAIAGPAKADPTNGAMGSPFLLVPKGEVTVGGWTGFAWRFGPEKEADGRPGEAIEFVMSADPALAPVGKIFHRLIEALLPVISVAIPDTADFGPKALDLAAKGAFLRVEKVVELQSVATGEIDPKRFELPAPAISAIEFMGALGMAEPVTVEIKPLP